MNEEFTSFGCRGKRLGLHYKAFGAKDHRFS
jgi:hypothetical protein